LEALFRIVVWCGDIQRFRPVGRCRRHLQNIVAQIPYHVVIVIIKHEIVVFRFFLRLRLGIPAASATIVRVLLFVTTVSQL
jgi:hypothetical protein